MAASINEAPPSATTPTVVRYAYRSFDRQYVLADYRLLDRPSPSLWRAHSNRQLYLTSLLTKLVGEGPAATVAANVPDLDHFSNRGGKDIIPLWRNAEASEANVTVGLLEQIKNVHGRMVSAEELFAYAYGVLSACSYTERYSEELSEPGPRLPISKNKALFRRAVDEGLRLIHLHTFGERGTGPAFSGRARCRKAVPNTAERYPEDFEWREADQTLRVGAGEFAPVSKAVWEFSISGLQVIYCPYSGMGENPRL